ncbi:MAG: Xaa-Pro aminopeptidase [Sphingobacteriales bacterium 17-39-43]|uniref:aminopeptidase P family protein n=1 Tax=Daejeonella sp. TaxID=2805397 RepID=UPI000BDC9FB2|nr:aminopeptidase P family protein [Daejeonella sp.]OYZ29102.1 MAG: Xaa-Pro aminopeptidase [Sphingobacteriales bacterium 16-39-50]OZA23073.1 MAG: Xaa-Pro aminopeptidase [Sphingobacteriales bacterium 17-39-43]HQT24648.1 aminopeptidase P N-terminal domain-containing protein [Daejeonella sp.]HQT58635.1 aminopeptidase P N-terminal domain-containing protein [Daejeonella sp.]
MNKYIIGLWLFVLSINANAQHNLPGDFLSKEFHAGRREAFRQKMPENSVAVIFSFPERVFSNDVTYSYHPNPDLYYLSGYKEPDGMLIIFKEMQKNGDRSYNELIFVRSRNPLLEQWTGRRLGADGAKKDLGFAYAFNTEKFKTFEIDFKGFKSIQYDIFPDDAGSGTLQSLINTFSKKAEIKKRENKYIIQAHNLLANFTSPTNLANRVSRIKASMANTEDSDYRNDPILNQIIQNPDEATLAMVQKKIKEDPAPSQEYNKLISSLREIKTPEELVLLRKSIQLSAIAHKEVMKAITPAMSESEITGIFHYVHKRYGAMDEGYPPIVGSGGNGCILHYIENNATKVDNQLVLMDVGSEYHGYSADITRTVPANGKFSPEQKAIYQLVYKAQEEVFKIVKEGTPFQDLNVKTTEVLAQGLLELGIIKEKKDVSRYYIHGVSHHLGLDVHDKNITPVLKENMVITVEPGIYIPKGSPCDPKWWDIAVRIEDDLLIGKSGNENLSVAAPRKLEDIEATLAQKSALNNLILPKLK